MPIINDNIQYKIPDNIKELITDDKRVFEALGSKMRVEQTDDQLSGIGFSSTQRNELVVKVKGNTERILRVRF